MNEQRSCEILTFGTTFEMIDQFTSRWQTIETFLATQSFPTKDWGRIFSWDYWTAGPLDSYTPYYTFGFGLFLAALIALEVWRRRLKKRHETTPVYQTQLIQISNIFYFILLIVPLYWFFRVQNISYLSSRLVLGGALLVALLWLAWVLWTMKRIIPTKTRSYLEKERFFRYLPTNSASIPTEKRKKGK